MNLIYKPVKICNYVSNIEVDNHLISKLQILFFVYIYKKNKKIQKVFNFWCLRSFKV